MDRRSRSDIFCIRVVVEVDQLVGTRNTAELQNMQRKNAPGTEDWRPCVFESSAKEYRTGQSPARGDMLEVGGSKQVLVAWARKLGIDKMSTHI